MSVPKRVLFVHDNRYDVHEHYEAISGEFVLRVATSVPEAVETAHAAPFACVVCLLGGDVAAASMHSKLTKDQASRLLFVRTPDVTEEDDAFMLTSGVPWISLPLSPKELLAAVRRIVVDGHL